MKLLHRLKTSNEWHKMQPANECDNTVNVFWGEEMIINICNDNINLLPDSKSKIETIQQSKQLIMSRMIELNVLGIPQAVTMSYVLHSMIMDNIKHMKPSGVELAVAILYMMEGDHLEIVEEKDTPLVIDNTVLDDNFVMSMLYQIGISIVTL